MKRFSRILVLPAALFVANVSAIVCPVPAAMKCKEALFKDKYVIGSALLADKFCDKNEHAKKAFIGSIGRSLDDAKMDSKDFAHRLVIDYAIRKGSDMVGLDGLKKTVSEKLDVLPKGMVRDMVKPVIDGTVDLATHPETLTVIVMDHVIPAITQ